MRSLMRGAWALALGASIAAPAVMAAQQADTRPVVAVLYFDNNSIGKDRADFDGLGKGVADLLITDLAANSNVRVVEREKIQALLQERDLTKAGAIDAATAVQIGKLVGAQYMITGGFMSTGKGDMVLTSRAINVQTSEISNPQKVQAKGDDVLGLIANLSSKLQKDMKLPAMKVGMRGSVEPAGEPAGSSVGQGTAAPAASPAQPAQQQVAQAPAKPVKLDVRTALLYSKALDAQDSGDKGKAVELYKQVLARFPDFGPAKNNLAKVAG